MKKMIAVIVTLAMLLAFAGCGGDGDNKTEDTEKSKVTSIVGNWECDDIEMTDSGEKADEETVRTMFGDDFSSVLEFAAYSDGTADLTLMGDEGAVSWSEKKNKEYKLSDPDSKSGDSNEMTARLEGENLIINIKESYSSDGKEQVMEMKFTMKYAGKKSRLVKGWDVTLSDDEVYAMSNAMAGGSFVEADGILYGDYGGREWGAGSFTAAKINDGKLENKTVVEKNTKASCLSVYDGHVYGILDGDRIVRVEAGKTEADILYKGECGHLQVTKNGIFFTDGNSRYCKVDLNGKNKETVLDKAVYYPYQVNSEFLVYQDDADDETLHVYNMKEETDTRISNIVSYAPVIRGDNIYFYTPGSGEDMKYMCRVNMYSGKEKKAGKESVLYSYYLTPDSIIAAKGGFVKVDYAEWDKLADQSNVGMESYPVYSNGEIWITKTSGENFMGPETFGTDDEKSIGYSYIKDEN